MSAIQSAIVIITLNPLYFIKTEIRFIIYCFTVYLKNQAGKFRARSSPKISTLAFPSFDDPVQTHYLHHH